MSQINRFALIGIECLENRRLLASANSLLTYDFEGTNDWAGKNATNTAANGSTSIFVLGKGPYGTINTAGSTTASQGEELQVEPPPTGSWTSVLDSGKLPVSNTETNLGLLTLRFSLKVSQGKPIQVYLNSYASSGAITPSGALQTTIYPSAANTYEHYEIDLSSMVKSGANTLVPTAPYMSIAFEMSSTRGWTANTPTLSVDNVNLAKPTYYVKPGGNNGLDGKSVANAFATPGKAASVAAAGDIIELMTDSTGSTYTVGSDGTNAISLKNAGTPAQWITMKAYPGQSPVINSSWWNAISVGDGTTTRQSTLPATAYIDVRGLHLHGDADTVDHTNAGSSSGVLTNGNGISVDGRYMNNKPHDIVFSDNLVEYFPGGGINALEADRVSVQHNSVRDNAWWTTNGSSGISVFSSYSFDGTSNYTRLVTKNTAYSNQTY